MAIKYNSGTGKNENWIIEETEFNIDYIGKTEAIMSLGNGYMGLRSVAEERYCNETRNLFIAGTFNKFDELEVTELPNAADITELNIIINDKKFTLLNGKIKKYSKKLNMKKAELIRELIWENSKGEEFEFKFRRFVSLENLHLIGMKLEITPLNCNAKVEISSGINAQMTNSGAQHFHEGEKRFYDKKYLELIQTTTESKIDFVFKVVHQIYVNEKKKYLEPKMIIDRRKIFENKVLEINKGDKIEFEKVNLIYTSRDSEFSSKDSQYTGKYSNEKLRKETLKEIRDKSLNEIRYYENLRYEELLELSEKKWQEKWKNYDIEIKSEKEYDQLAIRFAHYHMIIMTPSHDSRYGIAAKGLSGEGYKGHSFWDTEIFLLPFYSYTDPKIARKLLEYRYNTIDGARKKSEENGYEGAMYPWESAWMNDGEVTPVWGAVDVVTGKATKIWSGFLEQHITCDIAYAVWQYYMITLDEDFMEKYGYELLMETAKFWMSRLEWNKEKQYYEIINVIGPDEYKEHVDNNAFTNHMAKWNIDLAIEYYYKIKTSKVELFKKLNKQLDLNTTYKKWCNVIDKIYLPMPDEKTLLVAQDDTYLRKNIIDLSKYKNQENVGLIFQDYNLNQINNIQVSKQADIMILFYLLENKFSKEIKIANWSYYEPKTLHDSSLSLSIHCILANDMEDSELAYSLFEKSINIDLGSNMKTSDHGIHAASFGGVWQTIVCGFGGVRMLDGKLRMNPKLPKEWEKIKFPLIWNGNKLEVKVTRKILEIKNISETPSKIEVEVFGRLYRIDEKLIIIY